jgi:GNAT superfamily N-acetyltransferase
MCSTNDTNSINVRLATPADLYFVIQDHDIAAEVAKRKIEWQGVVVAERNGEPAGYARLEYLWSQVPYLAMICVMPAQQKRGLGAALLNFIEEYLRGIGFTVLLLVSS